MSLYATPRRRHSSLFERMQNQIKKISKKLSAAKDSYRNTAAKIEKPHLLSYTSAEERFPSTVRRAGEAHHRSPPERTISARLRRRPSNQNMPEQQADPMRDRDLNAITPGNSRKLIQRLQEQSFQLSFRLGKLQAICEVQAYKIGYMNAELKQKSILLAAQKEKQAKQTMYLTTLLEHYKNKSKKYKKMAKENSQVSIDVDSESIP